MPPDAPVVVEGYRAGENGYVYVPNYVEAMIDGDSNVSVVVWAMRIRSEAEHDV